MRSGTVNSTLTRGYGMLAGLGIIGAAVFAVPSTLLLEPLPPAEAYLSTVAALTTGLVCMALPWERMDGRWLHLFGVLATVEAAWAVAVFGQAYLALYFLIAVSIAYVTPDARSLVPHLLLIGLAIFGPAVYGPEDVRSTLQMGLVVYPLLVLTAGIFAYLRQRMVADHRSYRLFAEETLALADRIAGRPLSLQSGPARDLDDLPDWSRYRISARASAVAAAIFAVPLLTAGLATAGVKLPSFAADTFGDVGIELPNQGSASDEVEAVTTEQSAPADDTRASNGGSEAAANSKAGGAKEENVPGQHAKSQGAEDGPDTSDAISGGAAGAGEGPSASGSPEAGAEGGPTADGIGGAGGEDGEGGSLSEALEDTLNGLNAVLGGKDGESSAE